MVDPNRKLVGWKIWFDDGVVIDSRNNKWENCRQDGIQVVKMYYRNTDGTKETNIHRNQEYYLLNDLLEIPKEIKIGSSILGDKFWELVDLAEADLKFVEEMI